MIFYVIIKAKDAAKFERLCDENRIEIIDLEILSKSGGNPRYQVSVDSIKAWSKLGEFYFS